MLIRKRETAGLLRAALCCIEDGNTQATGGDKPGAAPAALATDGAKKDAAAKPAAADAPKKEEKKMDTKKTQGGKKKAAAKKSAAKKPATKKSNGAKKEIASYPACSKKNPYREGSMKAKAYAVFAKGGTRASIIAAIQKLGATAGTASSWTQRFRSYAAPGGEK